MKMELHDPPKLKLPPLKIIKKDDRKLVEDDAAVKSLVKSKLLLNKSLNQLLVEFLGITKNINRLLERKDEYRELSFALGQGKAFRRHRFIEWQLVRGLKRGTKKQKEELEQELKKSLFEKNKKTNQKLKNRLKKLSDEMQTKLDVFERKYKQKLNILENLNLYICKNCKRILCLDRFHSTKCECGQSISGPSDYEVIPIYRFGEQITSFIFNNIWLEHGIDYLLRRKNFKTLCGYYILGHSGIEHEIDNIGEIRSENLRIFCECKNQDVIVRNVFVFSGKMNDIGCTRGYIFTTSFETSKEVKHLARSKNISIIESVLEKDDNKIIKEIR